MVTETKIAFSVRDLVAMGIAGKSTLWNWIGDGTLPAVRLGGRTVILRDALETFLKTRPAARPLGNQRGGQK